MDKKRIVIVSLIAVLIIILGVQAVVLFENDEQTQEIQEDLLIISPDKQEETERSEETSVMPENKKNETLVEKAEEPERREEEKKNQNIEEESGENPKTQEKDKSKVIDLPLVPIERLR